MSPMRRRVAVLLGSLVLLAGAAFGLSAVARAETIDRFDVAVTVNPDTTFRVVESITYDFEAAYRHGIFRDIPQYDETITGERRDYGVTVNGVTMDGQPVPWTTSENGPFLNVRIGDPNETITGPHAYVVDYTVTDGLRSLTADDLDDPAMPAGLAVGDVELYWDLVGTGWEVPIASARASVTGPGDVLSATCYSGSSGSDTRCPTATASHIALYGPVQLSPGGALTGATVYPGGAFTSAPVENVSRGLPSNPWVGFVGALIPASLLVAVPIGIALTRRRVDAGAPVPGAPPQYAPPEGLSPAELSAAWQGRKGTTDARTLVATLLDLAGRRWINVSTSGGHLAVDWVGAGTPALKVWEEQLLGVILKGGGTATLGGYDKELATAWGSAVRSLVDDQETVGRRNPAGDRPDQRWRWLAAIAVVLIGIGFVSIFIEQPFITSVALTVGVAALIGFIVARAITPRAQTPRSARFLAEVDGFRKVLGTDAAAARREFAQRLGVSPAAIFATMLPFAVVFELEGSWIGAFRDLDEPQLAGQGFYVGGIGSMDSLVSSGTTSVSSAMTAPSSGSGGGGSSGGGGGGGGGGSW